MEAPPNFSPAPAKSGNGKIVLIIIVAMGFACLLCVGGVGVAGYFGFQKVQGLISCTIGVQEIRDATIAYAKAHNDTLPKAETWMDDVRPYYEKEAEGSKEQPFGRIPTQGTWSCTQEGRTTAIAFNKELSGKKLSEIKDPKETVLIFETEGPALNLAKAYVVQDEATSPKVVNEPRGWITAPIEGEIKTGKKKLKVRAKGGPVQIDAN